ncbi:MAG: hypothetical protein AB7H88_18120 [Vicinamibacterales bacterium]
MDAIVGSFGAALHAAILKTRPPRGTARPDTEALYKALESTETVVSARFGGHVFHRYRGRASNKKPSYAKKSKKALEYLWDFSFSRFAIPQVIEQKGATPIHGGKYELLVVAESELGSPDEVCRDLLKLLDARCRVRCLIYRRPKRSPACDALHQRMVRIMHNHAHFTPRREVWLLVGLEWGPSRLGCCVHTLNSRGTGFRLVKAEATA